MIHLELCYSKKIGLPSYSSHSCSVAVRTELSNIGEIDDQCRSLYSHLQQTVDSELQQSGWLPGENATKGQNNLESSAANSGRKHHEDADAPESMRWRCSEKQQSLIERIVDEHQLNWQELNSLAHARFEKSVTELNKLEASGLIDELLEKHGRGSTPNGRAGRSGYRRKAAHA